MPNSFEATEAAFAELSKETPADAGEASPATQTATESTAEAKEQAASATLATEGQPKDTSQKPSTEINDQVPLTGTLPVERHKAILEKTRTDFESRLAKIAWAEKYNLPAETIEERLRAAELAESDPIAFLERFEAAVTGDPRLGPLLRSRRQPAQPKKEEKPVEEEMPRANVEVDDGTRLYSEDQAQKLVSWLERRITRQIEDRYAPIEAEHKRGQAWQSALERNKVRLEDARTSWPGFKEHEVDIATYLQKDGRATLDSAYRAVVVPALKADRAQMEAELRKGLIAELNDKAKVTTEKPGSVTTTVKKDFKGMTTSDIVAATVAEMEGSS
jgi:hypothetical protein